MDEPRRQLRRDTPASYRICLQGMLDKSWQEYLGMTISFVEAPTEAPMTILSGQLVDQAALIGVLNNVYDLGFSLLSVECLECKQVWDRQESYITP